MEKDEAGRVSQGASDGTPVFRINLVVSISNAGSWVPSLLNHSLRGWSPIVYQASGGFLFALIFEDYLTAQ